MALAKSQRSLKAWGDQKWTTKSGKKSSETGERYLPKRAIQALSPQEYAATTRAKRAGKATFLPLNKIKVPKFTQDATLRLADGFVSYAVDLVECDQPVIMMYLPMFLVQR